MDQSSLSLKFLKKSRDKTGEAQDLARPASLKFLEKSRDKTSEAQDLARPASLKFLEKSWDKTSEAQDLMRPASLKFLEKSRDKTSEAQDFVCPASLKLFKRRRGKNKAKTLFLKRKRLDKKKAARGLDQFSLKFSDIVLPCPVRQNSCVSGNPGHSEALKPAVSQNSRVSGNSEIRLKRSNRIGIKEKYHPLFVKKQQLFLYSSFVENAAFTERKRLKNSKQISMGQFDWESSAVFRFTPGRPQSFDRGFPEKKPQRSKSILIKSKKGQLLIETLFVIISLLAFLSAVQFFQSLSRKEIQKQRVTKENFHKGKTLTAPWLK